MTDAVIALRTFNRFHTRFVGALSAHYMGSDLSLTEVRVLYELDSREVPLAVEIRSALGIDAGYMSRILRKFETRGWIERGRGSDARQRPISLTDEGSAVFAALNERTRVDVVRSLAHLHPADQVRLAGALDHVRHALDVETPAREFSLRIWRTGDMGAIAARQSMLYKEVYGWAHGMEIMIHEILAQFLKDEGKKRQQCWVAEVGGEMAGCVFLVDAGDNVGQLRLLYTESWARGLGIGEALVRACVDFAREAGYREIMLWTHTKLISARKIYDGVGFSMRSVEMHDEFGEPEQGETWALVF